MAGAYRQSKSTLGVGVSSVAVTPTSAILAGSLLVACTSGWARAAAAGNVTDSRSNSYSIREHADGTNTHVGIYEALNAAAGSTTVTFAPTGGAQDTDIAVVEFTGAATSSAYDKSTQSVGNSNTTTQTTGTTATTTQAGEIWIGVVSNEGPQSGAWTGLTAGWTKAEEQDTASNMPIYVAYRIVSSTGTAGFTVTGASHPYAGAVATYKDDTGGGAPDPFPLLPGRAISPLYRM